MLRKTNILLKNWEYWPIWIVYLPIAFYYFYLSLKARSFFFFSWVNPNMEAGGLFGTSKAKQLDFLAESYKPKSILLPFEVSLDKINDELIKQQLSYPFILKPDKAERGVGVELIKNDVELKTYLQQQSSKDLILQEYVNYPIELGVFFIKYPNEQKGSVVSIVEKEFLSVVGNGENTVYELLEKNERAQVAIQKVKRLPKKLLDYIPQKGVAQIVEPIGNHNRGTKFIDRTDLLNEQINAVFTSICASLPDFHYGRLDLKIKSWDSLITGKGIKIFEINGVNSEPAHIYDPKNSYFSGIKTLLNHWKIIYNISQVNKHLQKENSSGFEAILFHYKQRKLALK